MGKMYTDLQNLLAAVRDNPNDPWLREVAADKMEELHGHRLIEPFIPLWPQLPKPCWLCRGTGRIRITIQDDVRAICQVCMGKGIGASFDLVDAFRKATESVRDFIIANFGVPREIIEGTGQGQPVGIISGPSMVTFGGQKLRVKDWKIEPAARSKPRKARAKKRGK